MTKEQAEQKAVELFDYFKDKFYLLKHTDRNYKVNRVDALGFNNDYQIRIIVEPLFSDLTGSTPNYSPEEFSAFFSEM